MGTGDLSIGDYDPYAGAYLASVTRREQGEAGDSYGILPHLPHLLDLVGDVRDRRALDAACGKGYLARVLAAPASRASTCHPASSARPGRRTRTAPSTTGWRT